MKISTVSRGGPDIGGDGHSIITLPKHQVLTWATMEPISIFSQSSQLHCWRNPPPPPPSHRRADCPYSYFISCLPLALSFHHSPSKYQLLESILPYYVAPKLELRASDLQTVLFHSRYLKDSFI